jgi:outer membrane protein OmpA-like peptidoglycan-associated protein
MGKCSSTILLLFFLLGAGVTASAQKSKLRRATQLMEALYYEEAIDLYERILEKDGQQPDAIRGLAEACRKAGQLTAAEQWYERSLALPDVTPIYFYHYGQVLLQNGKCEDAQRAFDEFLRRKPYDTRNRVLEDVCAYRQRLLERGIRRTAVDHPAFNTTGSELGAAFFGDGLVFGSVRSRSAGADAFYDLYFTRPDSLDAGTGRVVHYDTVRIFSALLNSEVNEAMVAFSRDSSEVFFTRNQLQAAGERYPVRRLEILAARRLADGSWSAPVALPFNSPEFSTAHPALSPDGQRLFFSSDRPGGFGGKDLWVSTRLGETWGNPVNLGPAINTEGDELYPFYQAGGELYFSSDGHLGLGGQDVFRSEDLGKGTWGTVENIGYPINTTADDFGLILTRDGRKGYFTSNRAGGSGGDDIYAFRPRKVWMELQLIAPEDQPLDRALALQRRGDVLPSIPDSMGHWAGWMTYDACWYLQVISPVYAPVQREICASTAGLADTLRVDWRLEPRLIVVEDTTVTANTRLGVVVNGLTDQPVADARVRLTRTDCSEEPQVFQTDEQGRFSFTWEHGCCYNLRVSASGYFTRILPNLFCIEGELADSVLLIRLSPYRLEDDQMLVQRGDSLSKQDDFQVGIRTYEDEASAIPYLLNIYYDLGRASVRSEAIPELNKLLQLLIDNPDIKLEISSHTDAQGPAEFNERLSERRARAVVSWLAAKGIPRDRLVARGYGETRLVNECADGVECSEEQHQLNRRTEFRVLGGQ